MSGAYEHGALGLNVWYCDKAPECDVSAMGLGGAAVLRYAGWWFKPGTDLKDDPSELFCPRHAPADGYQLTKAEVSPEVARHVLHHFGYQDGWQAGSFTTELLQLLDLWNRADYVNSAKLAAMFPDYAAALIVGGQPNGIENLRLIADISEGTDTDEPSDGV